MYSPKRRRGEAWASDSDSADPDSLVLYRTRAPRAGLQLNENMEIMGNWWSSRSEQREDTYLTIMRYQIPAFPAPTVAQILATDAAVATNYPMERYLVHARQNDYRVHWKFHLHPLMSSEYVSRFSLPESKAQINLDDFTPLEHSTALSLMSSACTRTSRARLTFNLLMPYHSLARMHRIQTHWHAWRYVTWLSTTFTPYCHMIDLSYALAHSNDMMYGYGINYTAPTLRQLTSEHSARMTYIQQTSPIHTAHYSALIMLIKATRVDDIMLIIARYIPHARASVTAANAFIDSKSWFRGTLTTPTPTQYCTKTLIMQRLIRTKDCCGRLFMVPKWRTAGDFDETTPIAIEGKSLPSCTHTYNTP